MFCQSAPPASSPAPRLRARSMFSLGTELFFAFWIASYSVGLPAGSPPPTRAATSMFLISRANILPRRASTIAFLCFVVAHLEWPLMQVLPHFSLQSPITEFTWAVTRCPRRCRRTAGARAGQHLHPVANAFHPGRANEHRMHRPVESLERDVFLERVDLPAKGVAAHGHIDAPQRQCASAVHPRVDDLGGQQDHPRTRPVHRHAVGHPLAQGLE